MLPVFALAQQQSESPKYALVIGNGAYFNLSRLANPVNDANDVTEALQSLGFTVEKLIDGSLNQMDDAVLRLKNNLSKSKDSYGFFFYAGHGVQSGGENYLIPADANIPGESFLRSRSLSVQAMLDELNDARNSLNVVVLDACRDNPFGWGRSGGRGLAMVSYQPADSIIIYATSAGQIARDGSGRNGLFTSQMLPNLTTPGLEVAEVFKRTGADVSEASGRQQIPAVYNQFFGTAYLGSRPVVRLPSVFETGEASIATGSLEIATVTAGTIQIIGDNINQTLELSAWGMLPVEKINAGSYRIVISYEDGQKEEKTVEIGRANTVKVEFSYRPVPLPEPKPPKRVRVPREITPKETHLWTIGASVGSSFSPPWLIGTIRGTISPFRYSFLELGFDAGFLSGKTDVSYISFYPFAHYAYYLPFTFPFDSELFCGWYIGAGGGYMIARYNYPEGKVSVNTYSINATTGFNIGNFLNISYTLRTDFKTVGNKVSIGYTYRF